MISNIYLVSLFSKPFIGAEYHEKYQQATKKLNSVRAVCVQNRAARFWIHLKKKIKIYGSCGSLMILKKKILDN